ncbi:MAG: hypothetical protein JRN20_01410 [Nitrososphaerota archaeon]|nr:hypothetical protein [Nitrososphaerota archaeon]MDG6922427.1 hypothetical protein [Nitrososphaerota archaeon]
MREEFSIAHSVIPFDNIGVLLSEIDELTETYSKLKKRYEDRLGILLRQAKESSDPKLQAVSAEIVLPGQGEPDQDKGKKKEKKRDVEERGWVVLQAGDISIRLANGSDAQILAGEVSLLFKVIETLKSKIMALESCRKLISEMSSQGFKSDRRIQVVFKDGLPKYLIPAESAAQAQKRFKYSEQFRLAVLK